MGPRTRARGKTLSFAKLENHKTRLQWGRELALAERCDDSGIGPKYLQLQWGRELALAERMVPEVSPKQELLLQWGRELALAESRSG